MSRTITIPIKLPAALYDELVIAAADSAELDETDQISPEAYALECVETILASRRLSRFEIA